MMFVFAWSQGALPAMVPPYKRMAVTDSKSGIPMAYQPINAYQHAALMQLGQQQQYIPVTCKSNFILP